MSFLTIRVLPTGMPLQEHVIRFFFPLLWFITAWIIGKREKSKRSAQDYNEIKRRLGK